MTFNFHAISHMAIDHCQEPTNDDKPMDLAHYEALAHAQLSKSKGGSIGKATPKGKAKAKAKTKAKAKAKAQPKAAAKGPCMKRPASAVSTVAISGSGYPGPKGPFGCIRCRGDTNGCSTCLQPTFGGTRFRSRGEWKAYKIAKDGHI